MSIRISKINLNAILNDQLKIRVIKDNLFAANLHFQGTKNVPFINSTLNCMKSLYTSFIEYKKLVLILLCKMNPFLLGLTLLPEISLKSQPTQSKVNLFILGLTVLPGSSHPAASGIETATGALLNGFQDGIPFTAIIAFFNRNNVECTVDDLLAWAHIFSKVTLNRPLRINNDTGIYTLTEGSPYNNEPALAPIHFQSTGQTDAVPPATDSLDSTSDSLPPSSSEALSEALGDVLSPLFGFLFTLLGMFVINVVIENMKTYYGIRTGEDEEEDKDDDDKKDDEEDDD
jgi:hypothetical protein